MIEKSIGGKTYRINKYSALTGRAIVVQYPLSAIIQSKDYNRNEEVMLRLMSTVEVRLEDGTYQALVTRALIDNHVADWSDLVNIELESLKYNCPQFFNGDAQNLLGRLDNWATKKLATILSDVARTNAERDD